MTTVFDSHFALVGFPMLLEQFGESIAYYPKGGGRREIFAIIERSPPAVFDAGGNAMLPTFTVRVLNSARSGISSREVDIGSDQLEMVAKIGETTRKRYSLMTLVSQDSGVTQLAVV